MAINKIKKTIIIIKSLSNHQWTQKKKVEFRFFYDDDNNEIDKKYKKKCRIIIIIRSVFVGLSVKLVN